MDALLIKYIKDRMAEMGVINFHYEPVFVRTNANKQSIRAYNQHYFLVSKAVPADLEILSDTHIFTEAADYNNFNYYGIQEFSGQIEISQGAAPIKLEFIKATIQQVKP